MITTTNTMKRQRNQYNTTISSPTRSYSTNDMLSTLQQQQSQRQAATATSTTSIMLKQMKMNQRDNNNNIVGIKPGGPTSPNKRTSPRRILTPKHLRSELFPVSPPHVVDDDDDDCTATETELRITSSSPQNATIATTDRTPLSSASSTSSSSSSSASSSTASATATITRQRSFDGTTTSDIALWHRHSGVVARKRLSPRHMSTTSSASFLLQPRQQREGGSSGGGGSSTSSFYLVQKTKGGGGDTAATATTTLASTSTTTATQRLSPQHNAKNSHLVLGNGATSTSSSAAANMNSGGHSTSGGSGVVLLSPSLSFRRKKKKQQFFRNRRYGGFGFLWRSRKPLYRILFQITLLFLSSFVIGFIITHRSYILNHLLLHNNNLWTNNNTTLNYSESTPQQQRNKIIQQQIHNNNKNIHRFDSNIIHPFVNKVSSNASAAGLGFVDPGGKLPPLQRNNNHDFSQKVVESDPLHHRWQRIIPSPTTMLKNHHHRSGSDTTPPTTAKEDSTTTTLLARKHATGRLRGMVLGGMKTADTTETNNNHHQILVDDKNIDFLNAPPKENEQDGDDGGEDNDDNIEDQEEEDDAKGIESVEDTGKEFQLRRSGGGRIPTVDGAGKIPPTVDFARYSVGAPQCSTPLSADQVDFTVVTQLSLSRLWMIEHHCARWKHAISIAVYTGNSNDEEESFGKPVTAEVIRTQLIEMGCGADQLTVQTVDGYSDEEYPVNVLRNKAMSAVKTSHIVYVDVDFWESSELYDQLIQHKSLLASDPKVALVMPAFALERQCRDYRDCRETNIPKMPHTKNDLIDLILDHKAHAFDPSNIGGHGSTRYKDWLVQPEDTLLPIECIKSNRYEPYLVVRHCHDLPPFQEAFTGYGKNKMTWMMQLRRTGYRLLQLGGGAYVVHYPHLDSTARLHWNGGKDGTPIQKPQLGSSSSSTARRDTTTSTTTSGGDAVTDYTMYKRGQIDQTFVQFRNWLQQTVPDTAVVPMCHDVLNDDERLWIASTSKH